METWPFMPKKVRCPKVWGRGLGNVSRALIKGSEAGAVIGTVAQTNNVRIQGAVSSKKRTVYKAIPALQEEEGADLKFLRCMDSLVRCLRTDQVTSITMPAPEGLELWQARKIVEIVAAETDMRVIMGGRRKPEGGTQIGNRRARKRTDEAIVVKTGNKTFAELLKELKTGVQESGSDMSVTSVRRTARGDILLRVAGGEEGARKARDTITEVTGNSVEMVRRRDRKVLHVLGADGVVAKSL